MVAAAAAADADAVEVTVMDFGDATRERRQSRESTLANRNDA